MSTIGTVAAFLSSTKVHRAAAWIASVLTVATGALLAHGQGWGLDASTLSFIVGGAGFVINAAHEFNSPVLLTFLGKFTSTPAAPTPPTAPPTPPTS